MNHPLPTCLDEILSMPKAGDGPGFHRLSLALQHVTESSWWNKFDTIRITGSNGKGSVTSILHTILCELDIHCGRYTSPHLERINERILIGDQEISNSQFDTCYRWTTQRIEERKPDLRNNRFGSFEMLTLMCIRAFQETNISLGIVEAGIGGRFDPTRIFPGNLVALTSIDLEHTGLLGDSKELIGYDKIDLCPDGGIVVSVKNDPVLWEKLNSYCKLRKIQLIDARSYFVVTSQHSSSPGKMTVELTHGSRHFSSETALVGTFQLDNIAIASTLAKLWLSANRPTVNPEALELAIINGLRKAKWPGRFETISDKPVIVIDVCHTPDACFRLVESVKHFLSQREILLVTGVSDNKAVEDILSILVPAANAVVCTRAYHRGERVERIASIVRKLAPEVDVWETANIEEAVTLSQRIALDQNMTVLVAGGLFLSIEFRESLHGRDPKKLRFY